MSVGSPWINFDLELNPSHLSDSDDSTNQLCTTFKIKGGLLPASEYTQFREDLLKIDGLFKPVHTWIDQLNSQKYQ
jgi:hypothetical protein